MVENRVINNAHSACVSVPDLLVPASPTSTVAVTTSEKHPLQQHTLANSTSSSSSSSSSSSYGHPTSVTSRPPVPLFAPTAHTDAKADPLTKATIAPILLSASTVEAPTGSGLESVAVPPTAVTDRQSGYLWRTDLKACQSQWTSWFDSFSTKFVNINVPRLIILRTTDRMGQELTVAHMQGTIMRTIGFFFYFF